MMKFSTLIVSALVCLIGFQAHGQSWTADNGNGTYTNPLFYDEFSDPDIIRVGDDFYLAGTTMHAMPGLVVLHSKDLVNWSFLSYAFDSLSLGAEFNLRNGKEAYGQGVWAPCIRYHNGMFYIFTNVNNHGMQVYMAKDPKGPWTHKPMQSRIYDLSVLFDDDGKIYAVYNYNEVRMVELKPDMSGVVEGTERVIIPAGNNMGEGHHIYKIKGKYYIISANYAPCGRMQCARADHPYGPYETTVISAEETMGFQVGWWASNVYMGGSKLPEPGYVFRLTPPGGNRYGAAPLHQGGIVDLPNGEWWGWSMMDFMSVGRTTCLSPVTWQDEWPYFGLPGNLGRSPRTWIKPNVAVATTPTAPYLRSDDFSGKTLLPVWQWNHNPVEGKWQLNKKKGSLRLHTMPAKDFLWASNTLTQRVVGPESYATATIDASALKVGDYAGLAYLNIPYAALGVVKQKEGLMLRFYDQYTNKTIEQPLATGKLKIRATGDYEQDIAQFSYSLDGNTFINVGDSVRLPYQAKTFQGSRYALFAYNTVGVNGGYVDVEDFTLIEPLADRSKNLPLGKVITLTNLGTDQLVWANPHGMMHSQGKGSREAAGKGVQFRVHDKGQGRVALEALNGTGFLTVVGIGISGDVRLMKEPSEGSIFQWQDMLHNQCMLLSLKTNRYVGLTPGTTEPYAADRPGTLPTRKDGTVFVWKEVGSIDGSKGKNPIITDVFTADPAPLVHNNTVYLYVGHDTATMDAKTYQMPDWLVYSTTDMVNWKSHGPCLTTKDFKWAAYAANAAQCIERNGKFYWYISIIHKADENSKGGVAIGVAVADSPTGPFKDALGKALITNDMTTDMKHSWDDLDPAVFIDDDGQAYLFWGNGSCKWVKLKENMIEVDGPIHTFKPTNFTEAPWVYKRNGLYYLVYAANFPETIEYCTAESIEGPWTYRGLIQERVTNSTTTHPGIIDFKGKSYFFYHNGVLPTGGSYRRSVCVEYLHYNEDGTIRKINQTTEGVKGI